MKRFRIFDDIYNNVASGFADFLTKVAQGESIQIDVMSYGGDLFSGIAMAEMLMESRKRGIHSTVVIYGIAASAAAIMALAADHVVMTEVGSMMLHGVYHITWEGELITEGEDIDHANARCMAIIHRRNPDYTVEMFTAKDNWYTAQQAKDLGFVDEIRPLDDFAKDVSLKNMITRFLNMAVHAAKPNGGLKMDKIAKNDLDVKEVTEQIENPEKREDIENVEIREEGEGEVDLKTLIVDGFSAIMDKLDAIEARLNAPAPVLDEGCDSEKKKDDDIMAAKIRAMYDRIGKVCKPCAKKTTDTTQTKEQTMAAERARNDAAKKIYPNLYGKVSHEK
jgi:ATP-dependent protease ClpP protease subunit